MRWGAARTNSKRGICFRIPTLYRCLKWQSVWNLKRMRANLHLSEARTRHAWSCSRGHRTKGKVIATWAWLIIIFIRIVDISFSLCIPLCPAARIWFHIVSSISTLFPTSWAVFFFTYVEIIWSKFIDNIFLFFIKLCSWD